MERKIQKTIWRDSWFVIPAVLLAVVWLVAKFGFHVDFAPGADYAASFFWNLLFPLIVVALAQIAYAVVLTVDIVRSHQISANQKILYTIIAWLAVSWLYPAVYICRMLWLIKNDKKVCTNG